MSGLIALAVLIPFVVFLIWVSGLLTRRMQPGNWKTLLRVVIVIGVFPLMVVDEIIGKYQFEALCKANGIETIDQSLIKGKRVQIHTDYFLWKSLPGKIIPMRVTTARIKDADTGQELASFKSYSTCGGWLMRLTPLSAGNCSPMLFYGGGCHWFYLDVLSRNNAVWVNN